MNRRHCRVRGRSASRAVTFAAVIAGLGTAYMLFESQWLRCSTRRLPVPGLADSLEGLTILHLSDVHAGQPGFNLHTLKKAVEWATDSRPDLIVLTGDILGSRWGRERCLSLLGRLQAPLGVFAVRGNHEYGLSKNPFAHLPQPVPWEAHGVTELRDSCVLLEVEGVRGSAEGRGAARVALCGADYLSGGSPLLEDAVPDGADLSVLLVHRPPTPEDPLSAMFDVTFSGHTHGGQIRIPTPWGLRSLHNDGLPYLEGVHQLSNGLLAVSAGIGTTFLPLRLLTRPEAVIYRLTAGVQENAESPGKPRRGAIAADTEAAPSDIYKDVGYEGVGAALEGGGGTDGNG